MPIAVNALIVDSIGIGWSLGLFRARTAGFELTGLPESLRELAEQQRRRNAPSLGPEATDAVETVAGSSVIRVEA